MPTAATKASDVAPAPITPLPDFSGVWIKVGPQVSLHLLPKAESHSRVCRCKCEGCGARHVAVLKGAAVAASFSCKATGIPGALTRACGARQDFEASDTLDSAMELVKLNRLLRPAVRLVKGMEVKQAGGIFEFSMLSVVSWFKARPSPQCPFQHMRGPVAS